MKRTNQEGFSIVEILVALVAIGLIGSIGWYAWQSKNKNSGDSQIANIISTETMSKAQTNSKAPLEISALGIKVNDPEGRNLQAHADKICAAECDTANSYFIRDKNDTYFNRCEYPVGISKLSEGGVNDIAERPDSYIAKNTKKIGNGYYYVFRGSHFQAPCDKLQNGDEQYEDEIQQYILDNLEKL